MTLPPSLLTHLPARTVTATFTSGAGSETHTETGPPLALVLLAAGVLPRPGATVVAVGSDGYGAAVTLAEQTTGRRPLLLVTAEDGTPASAAASGPARRRQGWPLRLRRDHARRFLRLGPLSGV